MAKKLMSRKLKKTLAVISLVCIAVFTVAYIATLIDRTLLNNSIGYVALFFGILGGAIFLVIRLSKTPEEIKELEERLKKEADAQGEAEAKPDAAADEKTEKADAAAVEKTADTESSTKDAHTKEKSDADGMSDSDQKSL